MAKVLGWDVGGAHLKAALADGRRILKVWQAATPIWQGLSSLESAVDAVLAEVGPVERHGVTMTGELSDIFPTRREGVERLTELLTNRLSGRIALYGGRQGFLPPAMARDAFGTIASANWHASASLAAAEIGASLFIDMGSTTTDILALSGGRVLGQANDDHGRLRAGELVYQGFTRTALMAVAPTVPFGGAEVPVMNEYFATMADCRRVLNRLDEADDLHGTADGAEKSVEASRRRLARMIGLDAEDAPPQAWEALSEAFVEAQIRRVHDASLRVLSRGDLPASAPVVVAGAGRLALLRIAQRLDRGTVDFADLFENAEALRAEIGRAAPAAALAVLAGRDR